MKNSVVFVKSAFVKGVPFLLTLVLCLLTCTFGVGAMGTSAQAHILMDAETGLVLSAENENLKLKMASTTKIMTSLLALEAAEKDDKIVTFTQDMIAEGSSMCLKIGDKLHLSDLATGMMMASGNDAANAVALSLCESFEGFAVLMNSRAQSIGMENTHFVTPSGLDDPRHFSTAYDMALLMAQAMKNKSFCELSSCKEKSVEFVYPAGKVTSYPNHNRLLKSYSYCTGGKTGYTDAAGRCLVSSAEKDGVRLIAVTLNAPDDWNDHKSLYEYGFSLYTQVSPDTENAVWNVKLSGGTEPLLSVSAAEAVKLTVPASRIKDIEKTVYLPAFIFAPVNKGDQVGRLVYTLDGKELKSVSVKADFSVEEKPQPNLFVRLMSAIFSRD